MEHPPPLPQLSIYLSTKFTHCKYVSKLCWTVRVCSNLYIDFALLQINTPIILQTGCRLCHYFGSLTEIVVMSGSKVNVTLNTHIAWVHQVHWYLRGANVAQVLCNTLLFIIYIFFFTLELTFKFCCAQLVSLGPSKPGAPHPSTHTHLGEPLPSLAWPVLSSELCTVSSVSSHYVAGSGQVNVQTWDNWFCWCAEIKRPYVIYIHLFVVAFGVAMEGYSEVWLLM